MLIREYVNIADDRCGFALHNRMGTGFVMDSPGRRQPGAEMAFEMIRQTVKDFNRDQCTTQAAALSYYTVFALPSLLAIIITLVGLFVDPDAFQRQVEGQFRAMIGPDAAREIRTMIESSSRRTQGAGLPLLLGIGGLLIGATGAFLQLQSALNRAWNVDPQAQRGGIIGLILKRVLSLGMLLGLAFVLLTSLVLSALLNAAGGAISSMLGGIPPFVLSGIELGVSLLVLTLVFAMIYKWLPDATIAWRDALIGAVVTGALFTIGKFAIAYYLGRSDPGSAFGAAGALAVVLVWIYYSAMIVLFGAEFTQVWAHRHGRGVRARESKRISTRDAQEAAD